MINWPSSLVQEVARRRVVFFLGSGVTASSVNSNGSSPVTWSEFLFKACELVCDEEVRSQIKNIIENNNYLLGLQAIKDNVDQGDYKELLDECFNDPSFQHSELHEVLLDLDIPITVTTNFDKIYDTYCESTSRDAYKVVNYTSEDLGDLLRSNARLIIKAHGSINEIQGMIFTKSEYHEAKRSYPRFYELLKAIFLTHTVIFIGCGMEDPDILLTLEDVKITGSGNRPHYALIKHRNLTVHSISELRDAYNIRTLEFGPNYTDLTSDLNELLNKVEELRSTGHLEVQN